jgi:hypothetical protein
LFGLFAFQLLACDGVFSAALCYVVISFLMIALLCFLAMVGFAMIAVALFFS